MIFTDTAAYRRVAGLGGRLEEALVGLLLGNCSMRPRLSPTPAQTATTVVAVRTVMLGYLWNTPLRPPGI